MISNMSPHIFKSYSYTLFFRHVYCYGQKQTLATLVISCLYVQFVGLTFLHFTKTYAGTQQMIQCHAPMTKLIISSSIKNGLYCTTCWLAVNKWIKVGHLKESLLMFSKTICAQALRVHFIWLLLLSFISIIIIVIIVTPDTLHFYL